MKKIINEGRVAHMHNYVSNIVYGIRHCSQSYEIETKFTKYGLPVLILHWFFVF